MHNLQEYINQNDERKKLFIRVIQSVKINAFFYWYRSAHLLLLLGWGVWVLFHNATYPEGITRNTAIMVIALVMTSYVSIKPSRGLLLLASVGSTLGFSAVAVATWIVEASSAILWFSGFSAFLHLLASFELYFKCKRWSDEEIHRMEIELED